LGHAWLPGFRAARIKELLSDAEGLSAADFCRVQFDQKSVLARRVGQHLGRLESELAHPRVELFKGWDGDLSPGSPAAAVFQVFVRRFLYNLFDTVSGDSTADHKMADRFVGKGPHPLLAPNGLYGPNGRALLAHLLDSPDSLLFQRRPRDELMLQSLQEAVEFLQWKLGPCVHDWRWGDLHQLTYGHPLGQVKLLGRLFNRGPYPIGGDETTIWAMSSYYHNLDSERTAGPVCRFVVDLGDLSKSLCLNAPGQSGQPGSSHYADQIEAWHQGDYHRMLYDRQDVVAQAQARLYLLP
jgi:penicillin amidase